MTDNELIQLFIPIITNGLAANGYAGIAVVQAYQPTMQGTINAPAIYYFKVSDHRYAFLQNKSEWDGINEIMTERLTQIYESVFQISARVQQDPDNISGPTASDLVNLTAQILQSPSTIKILGENNVNILRIMDVINPYFLNDKEQQEAAPSFDFTLIHKLETVETVGAAKTVESGLYPV